MKRLLASLFLLALGVSYANAQGPQSLCYTTNGVNCVPAVQASNSVAISVSTATTTEVIPLVSGKRIYVTSWDIIAGGTGTITIKYGTGSSCGTGTTSLTGAYPLIAQAGIVKGNGLGAVLFVPAGNALCITTSAAVQMSGSLSYVQF